MGVTLLRDHLQSCREDLSNTKDFFSKSISDISGDLAVLSRDLKSTGIVTRALEARFNNGLNRLGRLDDEQLQVQQEVLARRSESTRFSVSREASQARPSSSTPASIVATLDGASGGSSLRSE